MRIPKEQLQWSLGHSIDKGFIPLNAKLEILHFCLSSYSSPLYLAARFLNNNDHKLHGKWFFKAF